MKKPQMKVLLSVFILVLFASIGNAHACRALAYKPVGSYVITDFQGVCSSQFSAASTGWPANAYGFASGTCAVGTSNAMNQCSNGGCTTPLQIAQCGGGAAAACTDTTVATAAQPITCEYSCIPTVPAPLLGCIKTITSGSCGAGNSVCSGCHAASMDNCMIGTSSSPTPSPTTSPSPVFTFPVNACTTATSMFNAERTCCANAGGPGVPGWGTPYGGGCGSFPSAATIACIAAAGNCDAGTIGTTQMDCCGCPAVGSSSWNQMTPAQQADCAPIPTPTVSPTSAPSPTVAPSPIAACSFLPWNQHQCGTAGYTSSMPAAGIPGIGNFGQVMNPMAACCWNGWAQTGDPASFKMDCIERRVTSGEDFLAFYNQGGPQASPAVTTANTDIYAGVLNPNRLFMLNSKGTAPINGFYNAKGDRCTYTDGAKTGPQQMAIFDTALQTRTLPANVASNCCNLLVLGLERICPDRNPNNGRYWRASYGSTTRCTAAAELRAHYAIYDLCDVNSKKRARFHGVTSIGGVANTDNLPVAPISLDTLIKKSFSTSATGPCPEGFYRVNGTCVIQ